MRLFGTDGIRGEVGKYPLTPENVLKLAKASSLVLSCLLYTSDAADED